MKTRGPHRPATRQARAAPVTTQGERGRQRHEILIRLRDPVARRRWEKILDLTQARPSWLARQAIRMFLLAPRPVAPVARPGEIVLRIKTRVTWADWNRLLHCARKQGIRWAPGGRHRSPGRLAEAALLDFIAAAAGPLDRGETDPLAYCVPYSR